MSEPIRILHVLGKLNMGGAETRIMDLYRHIDRSRVQFDFLVHYRVTEEDRRRLADAAAKGKTAVDADGVADETNRMIRDEKSCGNGRTENAAGLYSGRRRTQAPVLTSDVLLQLRPEEDFDREAMSLGARIYVLPRFTGRNLAEYKEACREFFREHHDFAAVEGHMTSMASVYLPIAKAAGVPVTIAHARSAGVDAGLRGLATRLFRSSLSKKCDIMMSCSKEASISVFGRKAYESGKIMTVPNALDVTAFRFNPEARRSFRARYGIPEDAFVIGHVGRFDPVKNQKFLAEVGRELMEMTSHSACGMKEKRSQESERQELQSQKKDNINQSLQSIDDKDKAGQPPEPSKIRFFFAGKGGEQGEVQKAFDAAGLHDAVIFAGQLLREETCAAYQAFDLFAFPSLYEGLPGTVIEAQAAGLPCVIADTITDEVALTDLVVQLPLDDPGRWAEEIRKHMPGLAAKAEAEEKRADSPAEMPAAGAGQAGGTSMTMAAARAAASEAARQKLDAAGYDIVTAAAKMQEFYLSLQASRQYSRAVQDTPAGDFKAGGSASR